MRTVSVTVKLRHVSRDPLRGHLFENIAVIEAMKYRFNRGLRSNLSFYRDSGGNEVDLIMEMGPDIFPVEIKAAETVTPSSLKGAPGPPETACLSDRLPGIVE